MKRLPLYDRHGLGTEKEIFDFLMNSLSDAVRTWDYFVNWDKVFHNSRSVEVQLGIWDYLLGKEDFDKEFRYLLGKYPEIVMAIPSLIVRDGANSKQFQILISNENEDEEIKSFDFSRPVKNKDEIDLALEFVKKSGLERIFKRDGVKNLFDYLIGVEAGVDSNGRKNRSGKGMESLLEKLIQDLVAKNNKWAYLVRASASDIQKAWGRTIDQGWGHREFDVVLQANGEIFLIEVNVYGGGGSKLKAVAGEFTMLFEHQKSAPETFVWVTDGFGWRKAHRPLRAAFEIIDYVINLQLMSEGALEEIILGNK